MVKLLGFKKLWVLFAVLPLLFFLKPGESKKTLRVMTYSSFVNVFGPGPRIKKEFEKICACQIKWIKAPDSALFAQRLSLRKDGFKTDVVLGLDQMSLKTVENLPWEKVKAPPPAHFIFPARRFLSGKFIPYNWSPMSFISRKKTGVLSLEALLLPEFQRKISLPSPRTSTVGLQYYYWIWRTLEEKTDSFLSAFKNQLYGFPDSWSTSYALFQRGHVNLSFSYLSSLIYHRRQKQKDFYFVSFKEGHPFQVELAGLSGFCSQCVLGKKFIRFLLKPKIQNLLKETNYMFPVIKEKNFMPGDKPDTLKQAPGFKNDFYKNIISELKFISYDRLDMFLNRRQARLNTWDQMMKGQKK